MKMIVSLHPQGFTDTYTKKKIRKNISSRYVSQDISQLEFASFTGDPLRSSLHLKLFKSSLLFCKYFGRLKISDGFSFGRFFVRN